MNNSKEFLDFINQQDVIKSSDAAKKGFHRQYIKRFYEKGLLLKLSRGVYIPANKPITENISFAEVAKNSPNSVICLLSALRFHNLTTQSPHQVWIAINHKSHPPKIDGLSLHVNYFSDKSLSLGVQEHIIAGVNVKIFSPAKTVVDCFKFRNKIGLDVAIEALKDSWHQRKVTLAQLWHFAKSSRMQNVIRPYLEAISHG